MAGRLKHDDSAMARTDFGMELLVQPPAAKPWARFARTWLPCCDAPRVVQAFGDRDDGIVPGRRWIIDAAL